MVLNEIYVKEYGSGIWVIAKKSQKELVCDNEYFQSF